MMPYSYGRGIHRHFILDNTVAVPSDSSYGMIGIAAARVSFVETGELLRELAAVRVDTKQVERSAVSLGRQIAHDEQCNVEVEPSYASTLETDKKVSAFARRVEREATRRDFRNAERQVVIGDGAK